LLVPARKPRSPADPEGEPADSDGTNP
jgi:hypothetical protein